MSNQQKTNDTSTNKVKHWVNRKMDRRVSCIGSCLATDPGIKRFGLLNAMRLGRIFNRIRYRQLWRSHLKAFRNELPVLLKGEGGDPLFPPKLRMKDGWVPATSHSLPHLDLLLEQGGDGLQSPCRRDFAYAYMPHEKFPCPEDASPLRKMVLGSMS